LHLLKKLWKGGIQASTILSEDLNWQDLVDSNVKLSENVFQFLAYNPLLDSVVANLKMGPISFQGRLESALKMEDMLATQNKSDIFLLSLMYYHGMVTFCESPANQKISSLQIPNQLAVFQYLDRLAVSLKPSVDRFLRTLNPFDLQTLLQAVLAILGPMDDTFNEGCIKMSLLGQFSGHVSAALITLKSEAEVNEGEQRTDLLLELNDGRAVIIELKALMPHQFMLPVDQNLLMDAGTQLSKGTRFAALPDNLRQACIFSQVNQSPNTTHFWDQPTKREVHRFLQNTCRTNNERIPLLLEGDFLLDAPTLTLEDLPLKKTLDGAATVKQYFEKAETQVQLFGSAHWNQESKGNTNRPKPRLFTITTIWNTHAVVKEVPFKANSSNTLVIARGDSVGIKCHCQDPAIQRAIQKAGPNQGKLFYGCSKWPQGCGFFKWA